MNKSVFSNSLWMMSEKIISIFGLIFVTSYVAKYVGPNIYGQIAFATSLFQIVQIVSQMGSDVIIFKRLSKNNSSGIKLINETSFIRGVVYIFISIPIVFWSIESENNYSLYFIVACCLSCFFTSLDVYSVYYDARLESKKNVFVNVLGLIVSLFLRWGIAVFKLDPVFLSIPIIFTGMFPYFFRMYLFRKNLGIRASNKKNKFKYIRFLIASGSSFVISSISVAIYTRVSLLLLGFFCGSSLLGIYSVAVSLATSWIFVCNSFITSNLPSIFSSNNELETIKITAKLNILVILIGCVVISFATIGGHYGISLLYGKDYVLAYTPFVILCAATLFSSLGTIASRFIAKYSGYSYLSKKAFCVLILSIMLNVIFINLWGIIGAAIATLATEFISLTLLNYLFKGGIVLKLHAYKIFYRG